jgi:general secretion pathway protein H
MRRSGFSAFADVPPEGFTLVELMVVLVIIGLATAMVVLAIPERGGSLVSEAERFAARAKAARDGAIIDSRSATLAVGPGGYQVGAAHYDWVEGTRVEMSGGRDGRLRFTPTGLADPARLTLQRGERSVAVDIGEDGNVQIQR